MKNSPLAALLLVASIVIPLAQAHGQSARQLRRDRLQGSLDVQDAKIDEQRVQRQTEVLRLESSLRSLEERLERLERRDMAAMPLPTITIAEAEAAVELAEARLQRSQAAAPPSGLDAVALATHKLELARAEGLLLAAKASHEDRLLQLELDLLHAQRDLAEQLREKRQLELFVAKGYNTSEGLEIRALEVSLAEKRLQRAQLRLKTLKAQRGPATDSEPSENETAPPQAPAGNDSNAS